MNGKDSTFPVPRLPMPRLPDFHERLAALPEDPTPADLQPLADLVAERCGAERYPAKSVAAVFRHACGAAPSTTLSALRQLVDSALATEERADQAVRPARVEGFIGIAEAARRQGISVKVMADRLKEVKYRYLYGWPWWDGHQWWASPAAFDPMQRAVYMAALPETEPAAHVAMLPPWCARAGKEAADCTL